MFASARSRANPRRSFMICQRYPAFIPVPSSSSSSSSLSSSSSSLLLLLTWFMTGTTPPSAHTCGGGAAAGAAARGGCGCCFVAGGCCGRATACLGWRAAAGAAASGRLLELPMAARGGAAGPAARGVRRRTVPPRKGWETGRRVTMAQSGEIGRERGAGGAGGARAQRGA